MFFFRRRNRKLTIRIHSKTLPEGEKVFVVGNHELLGDWQPNRIPLLPQDDGCWQQEFNIKRNSQIEFKVTRGSWETEAVDSNGENLMNYTLKVSSDVTVDMDIVGWRDLAPTAIERDAEEPERNGTLKFHRDIGTAEIEKRDVLVWLPPGYDDDEKLHYPVLYMHDGQNVFDPSTSYSGVAWKADKTALKLIKEKRIETPIIVAVNNCASAERLEEYSLGTKGRHYLAFMAETVKPLVDKTYRTLPEPENTAVMGASMGGLCAFLQLWLYPDIFGKAACLSPTFILNRYEAVRWIKRQPVPVDIRLYMDCGNIGGERKLLKGCRKVLRIFRRKKFHQGDSFFFYKDEDGNHSEQAWAKRLWRPMEFLFPR